jgi:hypothetical protein
MRAEQAFDLAPEGRIMGTLGGQQFIARRAGG